MKKPRISKKVLETYLQCSRLGPNNCNDIYFAFEDMEQEIARLNKIIEQIKNHFEFLKLNSSGGNKEFFEDILEFIEALQELKEEGKNE